MRDWGSKEIVHDIPAGTVCVARNGGGGGYGDPPTPRPAKVFEEVRDGLAVAGEGARELRRRRAARPRRHRRGRDRAAARDRRRRA